MRRNTLGSIAVLGSGTTVVLGRIAVVLGISRLVFNVMYAFTDIYESVIRWICFSSSIGSISLELEQRENS